MDRLCNDRSLIRGTFSRGCEFSLVFSRSVEIKVSKKDFVNNLFVSVYSPLNVVRVSDSCGRNG